MTDEQTKDVLRELKQRRHAVKEDVRHLIDDGNVIRATRHYLRETVFLSTKEERAVVTTYIALCHVTPHEAIDWAPYLGVHNDSGAGKSTFGKVAASLAGGICSGGHSAPSLYRWLDENLGRLFVADEGERILRGERKAAFEEILLNGNDLDATIRRGRPGPKGSGWDTYRVFGPKMLISIRGADVSTALGRRIITIEMEEAPVAEFSSLRISVLEQVLREELEAWVKSHLSEIGDRYLFYKHSPTYGSGQKFTSQSHRQLWASMLAVAEVAGLLDHVAAYCRAHERAVDLRIGLPLGDALKRLLDTLAAGRYRYKDLCEHLRQRHGERADRWSEERIGRIVTRASHPRIIIADRDNGGRYVVIGAVPPASVQPPDMGSLVATVAAAVTTAMKGNPQASRGGRGQKGDIVR